MSAGGQVWGSRFGFLMASVGFAVGLGNIWRFPYVTGENGGSAFVLVYLLCAFGIGVPILMAEIMLGRRGGLSPPSSILAWAVSNKRPRWWSYVGHLNLLTAFAILITYGVVAGWVLYYLWVAATGGFAQIDAAGSSAAFAALLADVPTMTFWAFAAFFVACAIVYAGVEKGIERAVTILMPMLFVLLLGLVAYNAFAGGLGTTLDYLFTPDFSKVTPAMLLAAIGQAFFSIGVGMAGMMMYGAYLPRTVSIGHSAVVIVIADTLVALLAGLVIFPMVFANGLDPAGGAGLIFQTLPVAFAQMPSGGLVAVFFFLLLAVAAITSVVGLSEPLVAWIMERFGYARHGAAMMLVAAALACGLISVLSYNHWSEVTLAGRTLNTWMDFIPNQVFLPLGGLLIALFAGWFVSREENRAELGLGSDRWFNAWFNLLRFAVVPAVLLIFLTGVGE